MLKYQAMVEGTLILRRCSTNGCLVRLLKIFHVKVVNCVVELRSKTYECVLVVL